MTKRLLNIEEAAEYIGIKKSTIYVWMRLKKIPYVRVGSRRLFDVRALDDFISVNSVEVRKSE